MSHIEQEERKRFFNDDLDTSETSLNFKSENKESFLFSNSKNDDVVVVVVSIIETNEGGGDPKNFAVRREIE